MQLGDNSKKNKKLRINILGSCVLRDAFSVPLGIKKDYDNIHIGEFIQTNSPISLMYKPFSHISRKLLEPDDMEDLPPAWYKWASMNFEKTVFDVLKDNPSDYLICSVSEACYPLFKIENNMGEYTFVTQNVLKEKPVFAQEKFKDLNVTSIFPKWNAETIEALCMFEKKILELYDNDQIIFVEYQYASRYKDKNGELRSFGESEKVSKERCCFLEKCYEHFKVNVNPGSVIKIPINAVGDVNHIWGLKRQHFIPEIYQYLLDCYNICFNNNTDRQVMLDKKYEEISSWLNIFNNEYGKKSVSLEIYELLQIYLCGRIDISCENPKRNSIDIIEISDKQAEVNNNPVWLSNDRRSGIIIHSIAGYINIKIRNNHSGKIKISLRSKYRESVNGVSIPVYIDFTNFSINGNNIVSDSVVVSCENGFGHTMDVKEGQIIEIKASWKPISDSSRCWK